MFRRFTFRVATVNNFVAVLLLTTAAAIVGHECPGSSATAAATTKNNRLAEHVELAIRNLYAELKTMDSSTAGASAVEGTTAAVRLDDALLAKAKFVVESLRSLAGGVASDAAAKTSTAAAVSVTDDDTAQRKRSGAIRAPDGGSRTVVKAEKTTGGGPEASRVDVENVKRIFRDAIDQLDRLNTKSPGPSSNMAAALLSLATPYPAADGYHNNVGRGSPTVAAAVDNNEEAIFI